MTMWNDNRGLSIVEYIILATIVLTVVGIAAWQLARAIATRLDIYRQQM